MQTIANGVWPTMITPYAASGRIDWDALPRLLDWYRANGCAGVFAVCQSSEMFYLSLDERVRLARECVACAPEGMQVIASGHISDAVEEQIDEIGRIAETGVRAVVLVTNRMAGENETDERWIGNAERIVRAFPDVCFGLYECPYPYKRLLEGSLLNWVIQSGRFAFLKDTCCSAPQIRQKMARITRETPPDADRLKLFNANTMTLLESLRDGASGFCGVMANFHPQLYAWLVQNFARQPEKAERLQALLTFLSMLEGQAYPICAKAKMRREGLPIALASRALPKEAFGYAQEEMLAQAEWLEKMAFEMIDCEKKGVLT